MNCTTRLCLGFVLCFGLLVGSSARADVIRDLGAGVSGLSMNNSGTVAGLRPGAGGARAFLDQGGNETLLSSGVSPIHVTAGGQVVNGNDAMAGNTSVNYISRYSIHTYRGILSDFTVASPVAANDQGQMVGVGYYYAKPSNYEAGYVYTPFTPQERGTVYATVNPGNVRGLNMTAFGDVPGVKELYPNAINNSGTIGGGQLVETQSVVDGKTQDHFSTNAFVGAKDISAQVGGNNSQVYALNQAGDGAGKNFTTGEAFLYRADGVHVLPNLPGWNHYWSQVNGINAADQIVGTAGGLAVLYDPKTNSTTDLNSFLPKASGWALTSAVSINDNGQVLGYGTYNGESHGFLLDLNGSIQPAPIPEPATIGLFGLAIAALGLRHLKRRA